LGLFHARHGDGLDALNIQRIQPIDRFLILALLAQGDQFFADFHCRHDASSSFCGGDGLSVLISSALTRSSENAVPSNKAR
jgi:hypothetical protein